MPVLVYPDVAGAAAWLRRTVGFTERLRIGTHRVQLVFESGAITLTEPGPPEPGDPDARPLRPPFKDGVDSWVTVRVDDLASHYDRALANGARILRPPTTYEFGERQYVAEDIAGHRWTFSETVRDVEPKEWGGDWVHQG